MTAQQIGDDRANSTPSMLKPDELQAQANVANALLDSLKTTLQCCK